MQINDTTINHTNIEQKLKKITNLTIFLTYYDVANSSHKLFHMYFQTLLKKNKAQL